MAFLYISEYPASLDDATTPIALQEPSADQTVAVAAGSAQSTTLANNTQYVLLNSDVVCSVKIGVNPTATATNKRLAAGTPLLVKVPLASGFKVAVITNT